MRPTLPSNHRCALACLPGNHNRSAAIISPASAPDALTVGASARDDTRWRFSNWGPNVDILAPGVDVRSAWASGDAAYNVLSGTSMASPLVAGARARVRVGPLCGGAS